MADLLTTAQRSALMAKIRSGDTKPEWVLRSGLHRMGFRYSLRNRKLPGSPDLVFPAHGAAVFVHGCFWHHHRKGRCKRASLPKSNRAYWREKFATNRQRDRRKLRQLRRQGWRVKTVWECQLLDRTVPTILEVAAWLEERAGGRGAGKKGGSATAGSEPFSYADGEDERKQRREILKVAEEKVRRRIDSYGGR